MDNSDKERYNRLCKQAKYNVLCDYCDMRSLNEVQREAQLDLYFIEKLYQKDPDEYDSIHNLLKCFVNYICYSSDKEMVPAGLAEDDFNGCSYFELMKKIYQKFIEKM